MEDPKLDLILADDQAGKKRLWACRGEGKGCKRNKFRTSKAPCIDCMGPLDEKLTLEQVVEKLKQGDA